MGDITLPVPGVTPGTEWASTLNQAITDVNTTASEAVPNTPDGRQALAESPELSATFGSTVMVRPRLIGESNDGPAFDQALAAIRSLGGGVVAFPPGRDVILPGGHMWPARCMVDFGYNRVTHSGDNLMLDCYDPTFGFIGIGEVAGGVRNGSFITDGGANSKILRVGGSWGFELRNIEMHDTSGGTNGGVGIELFNAAGTWTEGTLWDNVMINMFPTGIKFSGPGMGDHSSFAYQQMKSVSINIPSDGVGWDLSGDDHLFPYHGVYQIRFWVRPRSVAVKVGATTNAILNMYDLRSEAFDITAPGDKAVIIEVAGGGQFSGTGVVTTLSPGQTDVSRGDGVVRVSNMQAPVSDRAGKRGGNTIVLHEMSPGFGPYHPAIGYEQGSSVERPITVGYDGGQDVFRVYSVKYEEPNVTDWIPVFGAANGRVSIRSTFGGDVGILIGAGSPEGVVSANVGSLYLRTDGDASTTLYVKTSGTGNSGWTAK